MKVKGLVKWVLVAVFAVLILFGGLFIYQFSSRIVKPWEYAYNLSGQLDTIEVSLLGWACDCAEWRIVGEDFPEEELAMRSIFIEAAPDKERYEDARIDGKCWVHSLKLVGQFYQDEGISRDYSIIIENPGKARVFRYDKFEVTDVWCVPDDVESNKI